MNEIVLCKADLLNVALFGKTAARWRDENPGSRRYIPYFKPDMICSGGRIYEKEQPRGKKYLHWKYGMRREAIPAEKRGENSNLGFMTCNFLIDKSLLEKNPFNEDLTGYGHEDTLFG
ncbi:MAG: hypothetical protein LBJ63_00315, partial [Prevotellaceae bacterium]|nr:hypothetical protein [Prevotellaceae bacterium]